MQRLSLPTSARLGAVLIALLALLAMVATLVPPATAQPEIVGGAPLAPADGTPDATIRRTSFGIPHIVARDWTSLGFGNGYATAEDAPCNILDTLLTARGERSKYLGGEGIYDDQVTLRATNLQVDTFVTALRERGVVEALMQVEDAKPSSRVIAMSEGYVEGVKQRLADVGGADGITDPLCAGAPYIDELASQADVTDLYYGIYLANLLASAGFLLTDIVDATPPSASDPGTPVDPGVLGLPPFPPGAFNASSIDPANIDAALIDRDQFLTDLGRDPEHPFGSNGTALGGDVTATGRGMVLGNPHFPWRGRYRFHQAQLTIPGAYDVAGGMLTGSPVVNIGWNNDVAWTHTVSTAYRFTPYEYQLVGPTTYLTDAGPQELETQDVTVEVLGEDGTVTEVTDTLYRTPEGWVIDAPELLMGWSLNSVWAFRDANAEHLRTLDVFLEMGESSNVQELLDAHTRTGGLPWVNTMAADREGNALYADHSVVPNVPDDLVENCLTPTGRVLNELAGLPGLDGTRAQGDCAWLTDEDAARPGIFGYENLPSVINRDWSINANDSYWLPNPATPLEGFAGIIGCEQCERTLRTRMVYRYVLDRLDGSDGFGGDDLFTHEQLKDVEVENRVHAAELAREDDDLQDVCTASEVREEACQVLAAWDGRTNTDSVGAILFREFWTRAGDAFVNGFDADDPVNTPNDLDEDSADVQQAMVDAVAALDEAGIPLDAPLGSQQVAASREDQTSIPMHGGVGGTGSANVVAYRGDIEGVDARYQITYGSSHIQAVAFTDTGVDAATIATFSNSDDPTNPHSTDQTKLWSAERWVDWPYTEAQQLASPGYRAYRVQQGVAKEDLTPVSRSLDPAFSDDVTADPALRVEREGGAERIGTSVLVSRRTFATADTVVLARADDPVDALTGSTLAASLDAPVLLTRQSGVPDEVLAELARLGARDVVLIGGEAAIPASVADQLTAAGYAVDRAAGATRTQTAAAIASRIDGADRFYVTPADDAAMTLAAAGAGALLGAPVLLADRESGLPDEALAQLGDGDQVTVLGDVDGDIIGPQLLAAGADGTFTASTSDAGLYASVAQEALEMAPVQPTSVWVAASDAVVDGIGAASAAAKAGTVLFLVEDGASNGSVRAALGALDLDTLFAAGGPAVLSDATLEALAS